MLASCVRRRRRWVPSSPGVPGPASVPRPRRAHGEDRASQLRVFVEENTEVTSAGSLTPEIRLRLLTPRCTFWAGRSDLWPYGDPYWAIYWPGGQALARYLLDNPDVARGRSVLDLGSGCGAAAIAARMSGAARVVANDIDPVAGVAVALNCELNHLKPTIPVLTENLLDAPRGDWELVVLGDMFYAGELADGLHRWLTSRGGTRGSKVLIGDPGRPQFSEHGIRSQLRKVAEYSLPESTRRENHGLTASSVWDFRP
ncbi:electron transfer flavoprotein beta subunit lysine methyltransferase [Tachyglossus aculeatus]|uniref:electron transfer flavoprotein beta subunit lysine methyltransferase n=1 Tax=Tachyglossus aculeatus TaxID=9261 RepID=UPI0018F6BA32|nr:electron transfer flavoprotein beta subunit lysine methyltransferase [Tachyglossus aculeatus]